MGVNFFLPLSNLKNVLKTMTSPRQIDPFSENDPGLLQGFSNTNELRYRDIYSFFSCLYRST